MEEKKLSKLERKQLKKLQRPSLILAISLFMGVTAVNIVIYYHDIFTGIEGLERPPLFQLILLEVVAILVGFSSFYFPSKLLIKDLTSGKKRIELQPIAYKFVKNMDGKPAYSFKLKNALTVIVDKTLYNTSKIGDELIVEYTPKSSYVFDVRKK